MQPSHQPRDLLSVLPAEPAVQAVLFGAVAAFSPTHVSSVILFQNKKQDFGDDEVISCGLPNAALSLQAVHVLAERPLAGGARHRRPSG